jgi:hypothetical protein
VRIGWLSLDYRSRIEISMEDPACTQEFPGGRVNGAAVTPFSTSWQTGDARLTAVK